MAFRLDQKMQRDLNFAIVDEVDSILIDEARTPLIISGAAEDSSKLYVAIDKLVPRLEKGKKVEKSKMEMMEKDYVPEIQATLQLMRKVDKLNLLRPVTNMSRIY